MKTVLFIILPYPSHYNACFGLAQKAQDRGFKVVFTGYPHLKDHIEKQGYTFHAMEYTSEYNIQTIKGFIAFFLRSLLEKKEIRNRYRVWYRSVIEIRSVHEQYRPVQIFLDAHLSHYYLYLLKYRQSITILSTKLSTKRSPGLPPLNSFYVPKDTYLSKLYCEALWIKYIVKIRLRRLKNSLAFLGKDEHHFQQRLCKKHGVQWNSIFEQQNTFFIGLKETPTLILGSEKLEFPTRKIRPYEKYFQLPIHRNEEKYFTQDYMRVLERIQYLKNTRAFSTIYCAWGTLNNGDTKVVSSFMNRLVDTIITREDLILVVSTGSMNIDIEENDQIFLLDRVPQLNMLNHSDMMITHGGHNSIKECLQVGVPMLVYPLNVKVDQPGNAVRVYVNGYGIYGQMNKDTPEMILNKINGVLLMKKNLKHLEELKEITQHIFHPNSPFYEFDKLEV